jgi:fengycin family lipopeptide synthetase D/gramicidin S synthase 2/tyrocidine synthetase-2
MIVSILAVIKSGAAYVAIDPTWPEDRITHMLKDSRTGVLLTDASREELLSGFEGKLLMTADAMKASEEFSPENPEVLNSLSDILYVIYTSGSTGTPNGAMLTHDILRNLIQWQHAETSIDGAMRCLQFTSINFCVSFQETFSTLTAGGELYLIDETKRQDIDYLMEFLRRNRIEVLYLPFSYLNFLFNESTRWSGDFNHSLRHIITAGEQLKVTAGLKKFLDKNPELKLHNHYGSSEMHVVASFTMDAESAGNMPIPPAGNPIANTAIYILDENRKPVPRGVYGEICVKGCSEIGGYINNPELTGKKLYSHPGLSHDGIRLYCSGDLGRWLPGGLLEVKGRKDSQIKIRGFRVEPGEVESKLFALPEVKDCVVEVKQDSQGNKHLVAYLVLDGISTFEVKSRIAAYLPQYMIPRMVVLEALPLMPNGKVDRAALPEPTEEEVNTPYVAPQGEFEEGLAAIWSEILKVERIGVNDNFFELGGHSLKATQIVGRIFKKWQVKVELINLFTSPTIAQLAAMIEDKVRPVETVHDGEEHDEFMKSMFDL